jgi:hypothetical protein
MFPNATPTGVLGIFRTGTALPLVRLIQSSQFVMPSPTVPCLPVAHIYPVFDPVQTSGTFLYANTPNYSATAAAPFTFHEKVVF